MSLSFPAKVATGTLVGGTTAAGGLYFHKGTSKPQTHLIKDLLATKHPQKRLISKSTDGSEAAWRAVWKSYREAYKDRKSNPFSLTSSQLKVEGAEVNAPSEFRDGCKSISLEKVVDESDERYQAILSYCTRATLVSDLISETAGKTLLQKGNDFASNQDWKAVWDPYKEANKGLDQDAWNIGNWSSNKDSTNVPEAFVTKCEEKSKVEEYKLTQPTYLDVLKYCTKAE
ncbi:hypothetical protein MHF_0291 [Mycoplasma haemofelis Ohio2]|uniref:Uncharacterized protein n=1 Tax=Mycoplasma haemofelis (strain Ohio2) TaxID=859194 RepID=F6FGQ0_MYCHI|nr:hypothetical protein MHF_0291 [Mycoplasma haemofelis Ohio2]